jgi:hypothetical protein
MHQDAQIFIATVVAVFPGAAPFLLLGALRSSVFEMVATYVAFRGNIQMVAARVLVVAVCACCMGWAAAGIDPSDLLRDGKDPLEPCATKHCGHGHNHQVHASPHFLPVLPEEAISADAGSTGRAGSPRS